MISAVAEYSQVKTPANQQVPKHYDGCFERQRRLPYNGMMDAGAVRALPFTTSSGPSRPPDKADRAYVAENDGSHTEVPLRRVAEPRGRYRT